jgi:hypothetical protein
MICRSSCIYFGIRRKWRRSANGKRKMRDREELKKNGNGEKKRNAENRKKKKGGCESLQYYV